MVDRVSHSSSRIPIPVRSPASSRTNAKVKDKSDSLEGSPKNAFHENGVVASQESNPVDPAELQKAKKEKGFETFVMTGDMIIKTTATQKMRKPEGAGKNGSRNPSESGSVDSGDISDTANHTLLTVEKGTVDSDYIENTNLVKSKQRSAESGFEDQDSGTLERDHENVTTEPNSVSDLSEVGSEDLVDNNMSQSVYSGTSTISSISTSSDMKSDISGQTVLHQNVGSEVSSNSGSPSRIISPENGHSETNSLSGDIPQSEDSVDSISENEKEDNTEEQKDSSKLVTSKSAEKIAKGKGAHATVRASKSQELQSDGQLTLVSIDIDDDIAYSLDQIPQHGGANSTTSLDYLNGHNQQQQTSRSLDNSPEHARVEVKTNDREFIPGFISINEPKMKKAKTKDRQNDDSEEDMNYSANGDEVCYYKSSAKSNTGQNSTESGYNSNKVSDLVSSNNGATASDVCDNNDKQSSNRDSLDPTQDLNLLEMYQPPVRVIDEPSAYRLAKRLYNLDGFKKSDVARHLSKKNDFNVMVAQQYLKFFDLAGDSLDVALRKFLKQFSLIGETQERERVLAHFSKYYVDNNPGVYNSEDACHTLTCAIMLLNTDLHAQGVGRKMTCIEFIENLAELNDGENFPKELLKSIYHAIKQEKIEWAVDDDFDEDTSQSEDKITTPSVHMPPPTIGHNPYLDMPDPSKTVEYKNGYVMRKCCLDPDNRRTPLGKRGWKMFYASLRDMVLYLYKDRHALKKGRLMEGTNNAIRVHHCFASRASDYTKKQFVFRLQTADWAEYLFQTSDAKELQQWIDTINYVAASLSAQGLPGAVGSQQKFQRPLLPVSYTKCNLAGASDYWSPRPRIADAKLLKELKFFSDVREQLAKHHERVQEVENDLRDHRQYPPEKGSKARIIQDYVDKENFLEYEIKRYKTYIYLIQSNLVVHPELEPSLVETVIGEDDETSLKSSSSEKKLVLTSKPLQRSLSDSWEDLGLENSQTDCVNGEYINIESEVTYL